MSILKIFIFFVCFTIQESYADWITNYVGNLGDQKIGLAITTKDDIDKDSKIIQLHYFYNRHLIDIPLKLKNQTDSNISFEEYDEKGNLIGTFNLTFAKQDPQQHFDKTILHQEVLVGMWDRADRKRHYPVHLERENSVWSNNGGRCDLNHKEYQILQKRIGKFHTAVINNDIATLKKDFDFTMPQSPRWKKSVIEAVPHDVFCNYQGYMIGSGVVWFDSIGNVINKDTIQTREW